MLIKVLCVADYFLPGFKGGGPIRTIDNMRKKMGNQVEISIFTRDRDLGSEASYKGLKPNTWISSANGPIYYASPEQFGPRGIQQAMQDRQFDLIYLNSFFSLRASIQVYLRYRRADKKIPILLAPRGEFSAGALQLKKYKKRVFLTVTRMFSLYSSIYWHASSSNEKADILRQFPSASDAIFVAEDPVTTEFAHSTVVDHSSSPSGALRIAFISRISPMKNLDGLLRILAGVSFPTELHIYGPIEDVTHWKACQRLIATLPQNVIVDYKRNLEPDMVSSVFANYDLFPFPSHGENFGHVIFEALRAGTPVLVSDRTPWRTDQSGAITVVPLEDMAAWQTELESHAAKSKEQKDQIRNATQEFAQDYVQASDVIEKNLHMFVKSSRPI